MKRGLLLAVLVGALILPWMTTPAPADVAVLTTGTQTTTALQGSDGSGISLPALSGQSNCSVQLSDTSTATVQLQGSSDGQNWNTYSTVGTNGFITVNTPATYSVNVAQYPLGFHMNWRANLGTLSYSITCTGATASANVNSTVTVPQPLGAVVNPPCTLFAASQTCTMSNLGPSSGCTVFITAATTPLTGTFTFQVVSPLGNSAFVGGASFDSLSFGASTSKANAYEFPCSGVSQFVVTAQALSAGSATVEIISSPYGSVTATQTLGSCTAQNPLSLPINVGSSTTAQIIPLTAGLPINVCGGSFTLAGTTPTATLEYGTGTNCATGTTAISGAYTVVGVVIIPTFQVPTGDALCILNAATTSAQGMISYAPPGASGPQPTIAPTVAPTTTPSPAPSAPVFVAANEFSNSTSCVNGSNPVAFVSQPPANALMMIFAYSNTTTVGALGSAPAGFTQKDILATQTNNPGGTLWYKIASGSEGTSFPVTSTCANGRFDYYSFVVTGENTSTPFDAESMSAVTTAQSTAGPFTPNALSPTQQNDLGIAQIMSGTTGQSVSSFSPTNMTNQDQAGDLASQLFFSQGLSLGSFAPSMTMTTANGAVHQVQLNMLIQASGTGGGGGSNVATFDGCNIGTVGDVYNAPATGSLDPNSAALITSLGSQTIDSAPSTLTEQPNAATNATSTYSETPNASHNPIWNNTAGVNTKIPWVFTGYASTASGAYFIETTSDTHAFVLNTTGAPSTCKMYETYGQTQNTSASTLTAYSGMIMNWGSALSGQFPAAGTTYGVTAAGFPLFEGTVHDEELVAGSINHALNFAIHCNTGSCPGLSQYGYVGYATNSVSAAACTGSTCSSGPLLHYGAHLILNPSFSCPTSGQGLTVCTALKVYGVYLTDTGSDNALYWTRGINGVDTMNHSQINSFMSSLNLSNFQVLTQGTINCVSGHPGCI